MKQSFIINAPAELTQAHLDLIAMIEADESHPEIGSLVFMGASAPIAAADLTLLHGFTPEQKASIKTLTKAYQRLAKARGASLLVCGQAALSRGLQSDRELAAGFALTGYMEILAICNRKDEKVISW